MTLEEARACVKNTKYIVWSKEESIQLQKKLFEIGCRWLMTGQSAYVTEGPFLFVNEQLIITFTASDKAEWFDSSQYTIKSSADVISIKIDQPKEEPKEEPKPEEDKDLQLIPGNIYELPQGYEFRDKEGNLIDTTTIVLREKEPKLPSNLADCCKVLGMKIPETWKDTEPIFGDMSPAIVAYKQLLLFRNAYWKVIGGSKPYNPNWNDILEKKYCVVFDGDHIRVVTETSEQRPFAFPSQNYAQFFIKCFSPIFKNAKKVL
jgi:hypothetical protein